MEVSKKTQLTVEDLPPEILERIFGKLGVKDVLQARLVCSAWKEEIDSHYVWRWVTLNDRRPSFKHHMKLLFKNCSIFSYREPSPNEPTPWCRNPELLQDLWLRPLDPKAAMSAPMLNCIFETAKNLTGLALQIWKCGIMDPIASKKCRDVGYDLKKLRRLYMGINLSTEVVGRLLLDIPKDNIFHRFIGLSVLSSLESLNISLNFYRFKLTGEAAARLNFDILSLLTNLQKPLRSFIVIIIGQIASGGERRRFDLTDPAVGLGFDLNRLKTVKPVKKITLAIDASFPEVLHAPWRIFLEHQNEVEEVRLHDTKVSSVLCKKLARNNAKSLAQFVVWNLAVETRELVGNELVNAFDLAAFRHCAKLKHLLLSVKDSVGRPWMINVTALPPSLVYLYLNGLKVDADEFIPFLRGRAYLATPFWPVMVISNLD